ncbi:hypothetical protein ACTWQL_05795 [Pseudalkalibacillus sp. R45]|uniref:hypothetical protein n=1 Tax=Pseudalkalibacillus sp. R45 TaxID=3457433 RepID=UPI003FCD5BEF
MTNELLNDFKQFLERYRESWNSLDAKKMVNHTSKELKARWALPELTLDDWGYERAREGWEQAYQSLERINPRWMFEDILIEINKQQEGIAVFWVTLELDGELIDDKLLFVETFHKENGEWKKVREYVETNFDTIDSTKGGASEL